jgi:hypothetical protein
MTFDRHTYHNILNLSHVVSEHETRAKAIEASKDYPGKVFYNDERGVWQVWASNKD